MASVAELAYALDLKSKALKRLWVRLPPGAPIFMIFTYTVKLDCPAKPRVSGIWITAEYDVAERQYWDGLIASRLLNDNFELSLKRTGDYPEHEKTLYYFKRDL